MNVFVKRALIYLGIGAAWSGTVAVINKKKGKQNSLKGAAKEALMWPVSLPRFLYRKYRRKKLQSSMNKYLGNG